MVKLSLKAAMSNKSSPPSHHRLRTIAAEDVVKSGAASMESSAASDYSLFMNHGNGHLVRLRMFIIRLATDIKSLLYSFGREFLHR